MKKDENIQSSINKYLNIDEVIFDVLVSAGIIVFGNLLLQDLKWTEDLNADFITAAVLVVEFILSYFLGKTTAGMVEQDFFETKKNPGLKQIILPGMCAIVSIYILFVLWISLPIVLDVPGILPFVLGIILCIIGAIAGFSMYGSQFSDSAQEADPELDEDEKKIPFFKYLNSKNMSRHPSYILPIIVFFCVLIFIIAEFGDETGLLAIGIIILAIIVSILALVISGVIIMVWIGFYESVIRRLSVLDTFFSKILVPFCIAGILVFWENIYMIASVRDSAEIDIPWVIFALFFTGIIPLRLILMFKPPIRILNIVISVAAFAFYIYSIRFISF